MTRIDQHVDERARLWESRPAFCAAEGVEYHYEVNGANEARIIRCAATSKVVDVPEYIDGFLVVELGAASFAKLKHVERIRCPQSVRSIGKRAFDRCSAYQIDLPNGLEVIDDNVFSGSALRTFEMPSGLKCIGDRAFLNCKCLRIVKLGEGLERIGEGAFGNAESLDELVLPASVTDIGFDLFWYPSAWSSAARPRLRISSENNRYFLDSNGVLYERTDEGLVLRDASYASQNVSTLVVPREVRAIADLAFVNASGVDEIVLHEGIVRVGEAALMARRPFRTVSIELDGSPGGRSSVSVNMPDGLLGVEITNLALSGSISAQRLMSAYDGALYRVPDCDERTQRILARLEDPFCLTDSVRRGFVGRLRRDVRDSTTAFADRGYYQGLVRLADCGGIYEGNIIELIEFHSKRHDVTTVARLLELRNERFVRAGLDYDL